MTFSPGVCSVQPQPRALFRVSPAQEAQARVRAEPPRDGGELVPPTCPPQSRVREGAGRWRDRLAACAVGLGSAATSSTRSSARRWAL